MVHTDDHATWELIGGMFQKQPAVVHKEQFKTAPYSDSSPITGMMKCVTNSILLFPPIAKAPVPAVSEKYRRPVAKLPCAITHVIAERRGTPIQAMNGLHLVLASEECEHFRRGGEWTFVSDKGWDHNPHSGEVQLALTLDHLDRGCTFTMSVVRAARMSSWNEAERLNAAEAGAMQKAMLCEAVLLVEDNPPPPPPRSISHPSAAVSKCSCFVDCWRPVCQAKYSQLCVSPWGCWFGQL